MLQRYRRSGERHCGIVSIPHGLRVRPGEVRCQSREARYRLHPRSGAVDRRLTGSVHWPAPAVTTERIRVIGRSDGWCGSAVVTSIERCRVISVRRAWRETSPASSALPAAKLDAMHDPALALSAHMDAPSPPRGRPPARSISRVGRLREVRPGGPSLGVTPGGFIKVRLVGALVKICSRRATLATAGAA